MFPSYFVDWKCVLKQALLYYLSRMGQYSKLIRMGQYSKRIRMGQYSKLIRMGQYSKLIRMGQYSKLIRSLDQLLIVNLPTTCFMAMSSDVCISPSKYH